MTCLVSTVNSPTATMTNCIFTALGSMFSSGGTSSLDQCYTGSSTGIYQTVGEGSYYLNTTMSSGFPSLYVNTVYLAQGGDNNISSAMQSELNNKTTYPPSVLTTDFTGDITTNLNPGSSSSSGGV